MALYYKLILFLGQLHLHLSGTSPQKQHHAWQCHYQSQQNFQKGKDLPQLFILNFLMIGRHFFQSEISHAPADHPAKGGNGT